MCDWSLGAHKIMHPILSLKSGVTLTGPVSKTQDITSNANEKIRLGRESSFCNHLAILGSNPIRIINNYWNNH